MLDMFWFCFRLKTKEDILFQAENKEKKKQNSKII